MENTNKAYAFCSGCGHPISKTDIYCKICGKRNIVNPASNNGSYNQSNNYNRDYTNSTNQQRSEDTKESSQSIFDKINDYVGNTGSRDLNWKDLFTDVFKHHSTDEAEDIFICGTRNTTPSLEKVSSTWPKPWLYSRVLVIFVITFVLLKICWECFSNVNVIPGLIMVGSFAIPLTTLILFLEVNAFRNISLYQVIKYFFVGGCGALFMTLILYSIFPQPDVYNMTFFDACITPIGLGVEIYLQYWLLLIAIWIIVLIFINMGLNEVKQINKL